MEVTELNTAKDIPGRAQWPVFQGYALYHLEMGGDRSCSRAGGAVLDLPLEGPSETSVSRAMSSDALVLFSEHLFPVSWVGHRRHNHMR